LLAFLFLPHFSSVYAPQITPVLSISIMFLYDAIKKNNLKKTIIFTLPLFLKPQILLLFVPFVFFHIKNKKKYFFALFLAGLIFITLSIFLIGWKGFLNYFNFLSLTDNRIFGNRPEKMFTLLAFLGLYFHKTQALLMGILGYVLVLFLSFKKRLVLEKIVSVSVVSAIFFSPHALLHDLSLLIIPIYLLLDFKNFQLTKLIIILILILLPFASFLNLSPVTAFAGFPIVLGYLLMGSSHSI